MTLKTIKMISVAGMVLGGIGTILSNWADDKKLEETINEKVQERLDSLSNEEKESE